MSNFDQHGDTRLGSPEGDPDTARRCVACGYNLFGLGDEPRCPECGLVNIPEEFRREVWALVDSGKWFFSGFLSPFEKRPPGWWWALDRPGDVRRSFKFSGACVLASLLIVLAALAMAGVTVTVQTSRYRFVDSSGVVRPVETYVTVIDAFGMSVRGSDDLDWVNIGKFAGGWTSTCHAALEPSLVFLGPFAIAYALIFFLWAGPALVGLCTQIREGLPEFARAPRTIIAASNYEAHRLVYLAAVVLLWAVVDVVTREELCSWYPWTPLGTLLSFWILLLALALFGATGWVGPLRSDYTKQLVQSRFHAARIIAMYAVALPALAAMAVAEVRNPVFWL